MALEAADAPPRGADVPPAGAIWWELLSCLQPKSGPGALGAGPGVGEDEGRGGAGFASLLRAAQAAVSADVQWATSGVPELLKRASLLATHGAEGPARAVCLMALDFREASLSLKANAVAGPRKSALGGDTAAQGGGEVCDARPGTGTLLSVRSDSSGTSDVTSTDLLPQQQQQHKTCTNGKRDTHETQRGVGSAAAEQPSTAQAPSQAPHPPSPSVFKAPQPPAKRPRRASPARGGGGGSGTAHSLAAQRSSPVLVDTAAAEDGEWVGVLGLLTDEGGRVSDLCHAALQLPPGVAPSLPRTLHFTHLAQRRGVMLGQYQVVRTTIRKANMRQVSRLRSMAQHELVAVAGLPGLPGAHVIVVPYQDNQGQLRLVSFYLAQGGDAAHGVPASDALEGRALHVARA